MAVTPGRAHDATVCDIRGVTSLVLCGGLGTRLREVVPDRPKPLAEVGGRPFVTYLLDQLQDAGIGTVVMCTGYGGERIRATLGDAYRGLRLVYSQEPGPLGTGGALRLALRYVESAAALVLNGDTYCDTELTAFWNWHQRARAEATLLVRRVPDIRRYGQVCLAEDGRVLGFAEKNGAGPGSVSAGIYLIAQRLLRAIPGGAPISLERDVFPLWCRHGLLYAYSGARDMLDIGTPESYADSHERMRILRDPAARMVRR
jgi:NDP-sugar pyrophosphorylase family protein